MRTGLFIFFLIITALPGVAQFYPLPDFKYEWSDQAPQSLSVNPEFAHYPAVVLDDELKISVRGRKEPYMNVYFERRQRIRIQDLDNGQVPYGRLQLPESLDPFYDSRNLPLEQREISSPDFFNVRILFFAARRITGDGAFEEIHFTDQFKIDRLEVGQIFHEQFRYIFNLMGLSPGDEIELHYKYEVPFGYNWYLFNSQRLFFHGMYPVQKQRFSIARHMHLTSEIKGQKPDTVYTRKKRTFAIWINENLPGCITEKGIRPSSDLPHIVYSLHTNNPRLQLQHPRTRQWLSVNYRQSMFQILEADALWIRQMALRKGDVDDQWSKVRHFISRNSAGIPKHKADLKLLNVHTTIANEFRFQWDDAYYNEHEMGLEKMGDYVEAEILREMSRYSLYTKIIAHLGLQYYPVRLLDSRIGQMSDEYHSNVLFSDFAFAVADGDFLNIYYPKKDHYGYEVNEFPFYLSNTSAYLVNVDALFSGTTYLPSLITTPKVPDDNYRHSMIMAHVNTTEHSAKGSIETELSGQFSTLTRSVFDFGKVDSSINPAYGRRIFDGREVLYHSDIKQGTTAFPPYTRNYRTEYTLARVGKIHGQSSYEIPLKGWFNFVTWPDLDRKPRVLPFYPDFEGADFIQINLSFDQPIELVNPDDVALHEENRYGSLVLKVEQPEDNLLVLKAYYNMYADVVPPDKTNLIARLYRAVEQLNNSSIQVKLKGKE